MKVSATILIGTLAALANAIQLTDSNYNIVAGQPFPITWTGAVGDVTIVLKNGNSGDLKTVQTITSSGTGGTFTWTPSSSLPSDTYAIEITDASGNTNYSPQFTFQGSGTPSVTASTASSTSASPTTASSETSATSTKSKSTSTTTAANSTATLTHVSNSTTLTTSTSAAASSSAATLTTTSSSSSASASATRVPNTNNGHRVASSLALILGAVAAFVAFN